MKKIIVIMLAFVMMCALFACNGATTQTGVKTTSNGFGVGEKFKLGDETYALEKWVRCDKYDSDTQTGYGVCFLQVEGVAPVTFTVGGSSSDYKSLVDMTLDVNGEEIYTKNITFVAVDDADGFAARATFEFALASDCALPVSGTVYHTDDDKGKTIDLSALAAPADETAEAALTAPDDTADAAVVSLDDEAKKFCGDYTLDTISFLTPQSDNGIYSIDAAMSISEGFEYGTKMSISQDGFASDIDLNGLISAVAELPFTTDTLNFADYNAWSYSDGIMTLSPNALTLDAAIDETNGGIVLSWSASVDIQSTDVNGATSASGAVDMVISIHLAADAS